VPGPSSAVTPITVTEPLRELPLELLPGAVRQPTPHRQIDWIYLASQSPRRAQLLDQLRVRHELLQAAEALEAVRPGERPRAYVLRVTRAKWQAARQRCRLEALPEAPILCADTTVTVDQRILGKPADAADALGMLADLAGRRHRVLTAVAVGWPDDPTPAWRISVSQVRFEVIDPDERAAYVASGEPMGKAGAYGIQGRAAAWVSHIAGSYTGIMGLPLHDTALLLRQAGVRF